MAASELGKGGVLVRLRSKHGDLVGYYTDLPSVAVVLEHLQAKLGVRGTLSTVDEVDFHGHESHALPTGTYIFTPVPTEYGEFRRTSITGRDQAAELLRRKLPSPSSYASPSEGGWADPKNKQLLDVLCCHRPANSQNLRPLPVVLMDPILAALQEDAMTRPPKQEDCAFAVRMSTAMSEKYANEGDRLSTFWELFRQEFGVAGQRIELHNGRTDRTLLHPHGGMLLNVQGKNEVGTGGGAIHVQNAAYHAAYIAQKSAAKIREKTVCPSILIDLAGPNLSVSGAVFGEYAVCDPLTPMLSLLWLPHSPLMLQAARCFGALREALPSLKSFYDSVADVVVTDRQVEFPYATYFNTLEGTQVDFAYTERLTALCFKGVLRSDDRPVFLKFCKTYGHAAQQAMAAGGFAPRYFGSRSMAGGWVLVAMEYIDCPQWSLSEPADQEKKLLEAAVRLLHTSGFVHGNIRANNVLVGLGRMCLVDYEWAGLCGQARYPYFMNCFSEKWPAGAFDGELITEEHDKWWAQKLCT